MIDYSFIKELEGYRLKGYVPKHNGKIIGQSGVTIGKGLDLGNFGDLNKLGLSECLQQKLEPYVGLRRECAEQALEDCPLCLTKEEGEELSEALVEHHTSYIEKFFEMESQENWHEVDPAMQTIIASVLYQYGNPRRVPKFWRYALNRDVEAMIHELRNFGDQFPTRRRKEADYLEDNYGLSGEESCRTRDRTQDKSC